MSKCLNRKMPDDFPKKRFSLNPKILEKKEFPDYYRDRIVFHEVSYDKKYT